MVAKIAVAAATYWIDKPYDYLVPEEMRDKIDVGMRVYVPFARGNRKCEGIVLALSDKSEHEQLKPVLKLLDALTVADKAGPFYEGAFFLHSV